LDRMIHHPKVAFEGKGEKVRHLGQAERKMNPTNDLRWRRMERGKKRKVGGKLLEIDLDTGRTGH